jgi:hypothetical protein
MNVNDHDVASSLRRIRRRRLRAHGAFGLIFAIALVGLVVRMAWPGISFTLTDWLWFRVLWISLFALAIYAFFFESVADLLCPRCEKPFHMGPKYRNDFTRRCLNCGLRLDGSNIASEYAG